MHKLILIEIKKVVCEMQHSIKNNSPIDYQTIPIGMYPQQVPVSHVRQQPYTDYSSLHQQYDPHLYSHLPDQKFNQIPDTHFKVSFLIIMKTITF